MADRMAVDPYSQQLIDAVDSVVEAWATRCIQAVAAAQRIEISDDDRRRIADVATNTRVDVNDRLTALLTSDVDDQRGNPLDVLRRAVAGPTQLLHDLGAQPVKRDEFAERVFPDDVYGLGPASFADVDESLVEPGIVWGAWKAKTVLDRRRAEGRR